MKLRVGIGDNRLETLAFEDKLRILGVAVDPTTRTIDAAGAKKSSVKGGIEGLAKAASIYGETDTLDPDESTHIPVTFIGGLKSARAGSKAEAKMDDAIESVRGASSAILDFLDSKQFSVSQVASLFRRMTAVSNKIARATAPGVIGHTTELQRNELRFELAGYAKAVGGEWKRFASLINKQVLPFVGESSSRYNQAGDRHGFGPEAVYAAEAASGTSREAIDTVLRNVRNVSDAHFGLMSNAALFADDLVKKPVPHVAQLIDHSAPGYPSYQSSIKVAEAIVDGHHYRTGVAVYGGVRQAWISKDEENIGLAKMTWEPGKAQLPPGHPGLPPEARDALNKALAAALAHGITIEAPK